MKRYLGYGLFFLLLWVVLYHVVHTFFVYGQAMMDPVVLAVARDMLFVLLCMGAVVVAKGEIVGFVRQWRWLVGGFFLLLLWSVGLSWFYDTSLTMMVVGVKYDIWPLCILLGAMYIGWVYREKPLISWRFLLSCLGVIVVGGLLRQGLKILLPDFFSRWGYGPIGDYILDQAPPMRYRTGPGGMMRLQGVFSGPNNYGFFLVGVASILLYAFLFKDSKDKVFRRSWLWIIVGMYIVSLLWTLSRGAWIGVGVQSVLLILFYRPRRKKYIFPLCGVGALALIAVAGIKAGSTSAHVVAWGAGREAFLAQPRGYGLGSSGPAVHREGTYLPENHYLQLLLDMGIPGLFLWLTIIGYILWYVFSYTKKHTHDDVLLMVLFSLGLLGLLVEGLFLHVFEDSMVNYLLFIPLGILLGQSSRGEGEGIDDRI